MNTLDMQPDGEIRLGPLDEKWKAGRRDPKLKTASMKGDNDSEEAILFERTVQVMYSSPEDASECGQAHVGNIWTRRPQNQEA